MRPSARIGSRAALAVTVLLGGCAAPVPGPPVPPGTSACCSMAAFARMLDIARRYRIEAFAERRFTHAEFWRAAAPALASPEAKTDSIGASLHGNAIRAVTYGRGPTVVLLWSQMHGDEATATMALADIFHFLSDATADPIRERMLRELTIVFVPMLNPDGAELFQREDAAGIDVNRDARRLATPEARALKALFDRLHPAFGFNLHDQGARTRVGTAGPQSAIALLAPAYDSARSYNPGRTRARLVAATLAELFGHEVAGRVAKYDDTFNPRAFGDLSQQWGTSTVLIESGALPGDPEKQRLRTLNAAAILGALDAIATGSYRAADPASYDRLPYNAGGAFDLLVLGGHLVLLPGQPPLRADLALNYDNSLARSGPRLRDVGDLTDAVAIDTVDATGLFIHPAAASLTVRDGASWLRLGGPAAFDLRRGADSSSELVRRIPAP